MTIVVRDLDAAMRLFGLLGFAHERSVVISGEVFSSSMGIAVELSERSEAAASQPRYPDHDRETA
jgi:hypothetical protein